MHRITDKDFKYTPSFATDISKRFKQIERERKLALKQANEQQEKQSTETTNRYDKVILLTHK